MAGWQTAYLLAWAGILKATAELKKEKITSSYDCLNQPWGNNPELFKEITLGDGTYTVGYKIGSGDSAQIIYGLVDEARKVNLNKAAPGVLRELFKCLIGLTQNEAQALENAITDWQASRP